MQRFTPSEGGGLVECSKVGSFACAPSFAAYVEDGLDLALNALLGLLCFACAHSQHKIPLNQVLLS